MSDLQELGAESGGVAGVGENPTPTTPTEEGNRQPTDGKPSINLDELPEFRAVKSKYDSTIGKTQKELQAERQQREQLQMRLQQMEAQMEQFQTRDMDEPQRMAFEIQKRDRQLQAMQSMLQQQQMNTVKQQALLNIKERAANKGVDVSLDELINHEGADDAWEYILEKAVQSRVERQQQQQAKREANAVDLGGGSATSTGDLQDKYDKAVKAFDATAMLKILDRAAREGIEITI